MAFLLPAVASVNPLAAGFVNGLAQLAPLAFFLFLLPAPISLIQSKRKRKQLDAQQDINSIRDLSWQRFEELVGEAYRRQGYRVVENDGAGPDGGIDLVISREGKQYLVQCKQYRVQKVGVKVVREMYGLVAAEHATGGIVITSGTFTRDAGRFAGGKSLELVDGVQLARLIAVIQSGQVSLVALSLLRHLTKYRVFHLVPCVTGKWFYGRREKGKMLESSSGGVLRFLSVGEQGIEYPMYKYTVQLLCKISEIDSQNGKIQK